MCQNSIVFGDVDARARAAQPLRHRRYHGASVSRREGPNASFCPDGVRRLHPAGRPSRLRQRHLPRAEAEAHQVGLLWRHGRRVRRRRSGAARLAARVQFGGAGGGAGARDAGDRHLLPGAVRAQHRQAHRPHALRRPPRRDRGGARQAAERGAQEDERRAAREPGDGVPHAARARAPEGVPRLRGHLPQARRQAAAAVRVRPGVPRLRHHRPVRERSARGVPKDGDGGRDGVAAGVVARVCGRRHVGDRARQRRDADRLAGPAGQGRRAHGTRVLRAPPRRGGAVHRRARAAARRRLHHEPDLRLLVPRLPRPRCVAPAALPRPARDS